MGCLLGGLGQELSGVSEVFRRKIEGCSSEMAHRIAVCLEQARTRGATSRPIAIRGKGQACWLTAGRAQPFVACCEGMPRR